MWDSPWYIVLQVEGNNDAEFPVLQVIFVARAKASLLARATRKIQLYLSEEPD